MILLPSPATSGQFLHQFVFLFSPPTFDFFFARDCVTWVIVTFVVHEAINLIGSGEAFNFPMSMFRDAPIQAVGHAGIEHDPTSIGYHINKEALHFDCEVPRIRSG